MGPKSRLLRRIGYAVSFLAVAGVAAYVSYGHIYEVATVAHQPRLLAMAIPLSVDGLMLFATLAMSEDKAANQEPRAWARFGFWLGAAVSVAANIASTLVHYGPQPLDLAVAGWAPIALLVLVEIVARPGKPKAALVAVAPVVEQQSSVSADEPAAVSVTPQEPNASMAEVPVSPAPAGARTRGEYGPRNGEAYAPRTERLKRRGK